MKITCVNLNEKHVKLCKAIQKAEFSTSVSGAIRYVLDLYCHDLERSLKYWECETTIEKMLELLR